MPVVAAVLPFGVDVRCGYKCLLARLAYWLAVHLVALKFVLFGALVWHFLTVRVPAGLWYRLTGLLGK